MKGKSSKKLINGEKGQALIIVLVMMLFGSLILAPVLSHVGSGLKAGEQVYEERMKLLYAADSGIEDALWQINNKSLADFLPGYDEFAYSDYDPENYKWTYRPADIYSENVNGKDLEVTIENIWIPDMPAPSPEVGRSIIEEGKLLVFGSLAGTSEVDYKIKIAYYWGNITERNNLTVQKLGIWLPAGFHYVSGTHNLSGACAPSSVEVDQYKSGEVVVWNFSSSPPLTAFPGTDITDCPMVAAVTFQFSGPSGQNPAEAVSWIDTAGVSGVDYAWDADAKVYGITSEASGALGKEAIVEAHAAKIEMRDLGSTIVGDYRPIGATLMTATATTVPAKYYRNRLYLQTNATIGATDIPANATIESAYLYWSGWIDYHYREQYTDWRGNPAWRWGEIPELDYDNYVSNLTQLVETNAKVNTVTLTFGTDAPETITTHQWQVKENTDQADVEGTWSYSCFYDATDLVKGLIDNEKLGSNASGTYVLEHAWVDQQRTGVGAGTYYFDLCDTSGPTGHKTGYPLSTPAHTLSGTGTSYMNRYQLSNAGWSLILIYSTPGEDRRQLYLFDTFRYIRANTTVSFTISGFLAPEDTTGSKLTYFVGDGDAQYGTTYSPDCITVEGSYLYDTINPWYNVFNSESNAINNPVYKSGIDIDTFDMSAYIEEGAPSADIVIDSGEFLYLVYIILCFRSEVVSGGTISYLVR